MTVIRDYTQVFICSLHSFKMVAPKPNTDIPVFISLFISSKTKITNKLLHWITTVVPFFEMWTIQLQVSNWTHIKTGFENIF